MPPVEYEIAVYYHYQPPEGPSGYGCYRVPSDVEIVHVEVLKVTTECGTASRRDLRIPEASDTKAYNHIEANHDKYKEILIAKARS
jgi:hypothetical protein